MSHRPRPPRGDLLKGGPREAECRTTSGRCELSIDEAMFLEGKSDEIEQVSYRECAA